MSRTHVRRRRRTMAVLAVVAILLPVVRAASAGASDPQAPPRVEEYVVQPGDSLWGVAQEHSVATDPRDGVQIILQRNPEASSLQPGMVLEIPA